MADESLNQSTAPAATPAATSPAANTSQGTPNLSGKNTGDIEAMLRASTNPDLSLPIEEEEITPAAIPEKPAEPKLDVPDKFKNPDGTPNVANLTKSYTELEKQFGRLNNINKENEILKQHLDDLKQEIESVKNAPTRQDSKPVYTQEELELLQNDPKRFVEMAIDKRMQGQAEEARKNRLQDYEILTAINKARESLPGFKDLEPEIEQLADQEFIGRSPKAIPFMYYAALGQKAESLITSARDKAYKEGYEKAKGDLKLQVEGSGRDSAPADMNINRDTVGKMSSEELSKILPHLGDNTTKVYY
jgi:hypothetical protein